MKKLVVFAILGALTISSYAQQDKKKSPSQFTPAQMAELKVKQMALKLDLNKGQQTKMRDLMERSISERQKAMKSRKEQNSTNKTSDKDDRFKRQVAQLDQKLAYQNDVKSILTETQYSQWKKTQTHTRGQKFTRGKRGKQAFSRRGNEPRRNQFAAKRMYIKRGKMQGHRSTKMGMKGRQKMTKDRKELKEEKAPKN